MTMGTKQRAKQLETLLNSVERGNKKDAYDYTGGHLNEAHLNPPPEFRAHKGWNGAKFDTISMKKASHLPVSKTKKPVVVDKNMSDALSQFALGTDGFLPKVKNRKPKSTRNQWPQEITGSVDEQALIEEIDSRRFMLNRSQPTRLQRSWAMVDDDESLRSEQSKSVPPKHGFYSLNSGATKLDQYRDFKKFETLKLRKQDMLEKKVLAGDQSAVRIEEKLNRKLMILGYGPGTSFHRLQAHSDTLQDLIELSPLFSSLLEQIKDEYDDYVGWLLDTHPTQSHLLREQVDDLYEKRISNPKQLEQAKRETNELEEQGRKLLEQNDKLREELRLESQTSKKLPTEFARTSPSSEADLYSQRQVFKRDDKSHFDLADQLQDLHATILERLDQLEEMRKKMRQEFVPTNVCQNLEQCLKDSEIEVQKLLKQNEIVSKNISDMEGDISQAIEECDVSDRDKKKCLEKVSKVYVPGIKRAFVDYDAYSEFVEKYSEELPTNLSHPFRDGETSDDEGDEQNQKWDWYIS